MITLVSDKSDQVAELCRKFNVHRLDIFGSAATGDFSPEKSDLDFLVEFGPLPSGTRASTYFSFLRALEELFDRSVDLVMTAAIENPYFMRQVTKTREAVYGR